MNVTPAFFSFLLIFSLLYLAANSYILWRTLQQLQLSQPLHSRLRIVLLAAALCYPAGRLTEALAGATAFSNILTLLGAYWLAVVFYQTLLFLTGDLADLLRRLLLRNSSTSLRRRSLAQWLLVFLLVAAGAYNAAHPVIRHYEISLNKSAPPRIASPLRIALVSDLHLGSLIGTAQLTSIIDQLNALSPDLVLLPGDIIDGPVAVLDDERLLDQFRSLQTPLGVFGSLGNHEYTGRQPERFRERMAAAHVDILRDELRLIDNSLYIIGRDDLSAKPFRGSDRLPLAELLAGVDRNKPLLLLDHQPKRFDEAIAAGVDLQVSGHTHLGQLFPNHFITRLLYQLDYGQLQLGSFHAIVSCGVGTWGPPVRLGNRPEIVLITLHFN